MYHGTYGSIIRCKYMSDPAAVHFVEFDHPISSTRDNIIEKISFSSREDNLDVLLSRRKHHWIHYLNSMNIDYKLWIQNINYYLQSQWGSAAALSSRILPFPRICTFRVKFNNIIAVSSYHEPKSCRHRFF